MHSLVFLKVGNFKKYVKYNQHKKFENELAGKLNPEPSPTA
jgi:hypothetical protein